MAFGTSNRFAPHDDPAHGTSAGAPPPEDQPTHPTGPAAAKELASQLAELREYVSYLVATRLDGIKLSARQTALYAVLGIVGLIAAAAFISTAMAVAIVGAAEGLAQAFGDRLWAGYLTTGLGLLVILAVALLIVVRMVTARGRKSVVKKYAALRRQQEERFGHDTHEVARNAQNQELASHDRK